MAREEIKLCGLNAVTAQFRAAPDMIERLHFDRILAPQLGEMCRQLARRRKPYRLTNADELIAIAETVHHGGVVAVIRPPILKAPTDAELDAWAAARLPMLLLDRIGNPHNLGAIVRSAAYFGVKKILLSDRREQALPSTAVYRVAEGGMAYVEIYRSLNMIVDCRTIGDRHTIIGASLDGKPLAKAAEIARSRGRPLALLLGNEEDGIAPELSLLCAVHATIPGTGMVQSLNVSAAAAILIHGILTAPVNER